MAFPLLDELHEGQKARRKSEFDRENKGKSAGWLKLKELNDYPYFKSEKELRAMYWDTDGRYSSTPEGLLFKVDLIELIEFVYVAPFSMPQYRDIIEDLIMKYGLRKEVIKSGIWKW